MSSFESGTYDPDDGESYEVGEIMRKWKESDRLRAGQQLSALLGHDIIIHKASPDFYSNRDPGDETDLR